jgi:hypothetical protein
LGLSLFNGLGTYRTYEQFNFLRELPLSVSPLYLLLRSAFWFVAFAGLAVGLWKRQAWAWIGTLFLITVYLAQGWLERLWLARADYVSVSGLFAAAVDLMVLALFWISLLRPKVRRYFGRNPAASRVR